MGLKNGGPTKGLKKRGATPTVTDILMRAWPHFFGALCGPYLQCVLGPFLWADGGPFY